MDGRATWPPLASARLRRLPGADAAGARTSAGEIGCPTAIVWGRDDPYLRPAIAEELAARIPGAELTMLDGTRHFVMEERPDEVTAALQRLLER